MTYETLIALPLLICIFWVIIYILNIQNLNRTQIILIAVGISFIFGFLPTTLFIEGVTNLYFYYVTFLLDTSLLIPPTVYLFFKSMTHSEKFKPKELIHFIIPAAYTLSRFIIRIFETRESAMEITYKLYIVEMEKLPVSGLFNAVASSFTIHNHLYAFLYLSSYVLFYLSVITAGAYAITVTLKYHRKLEDYYSDIDNKSIYYTKRVMWYSVASLLLCMGTMDRTFMAEHLHCAIFVCIGLSFSFFGTFLNALRTTFTVRDFTNDIRNSSATGQSDTQESSIDSKGPDKSPILEKVISDEDILKLEEYISLHKPYLRSDLKADDLAKEVGLSRSKLSEITKIKYRCNFSNYICQMRIEYAKKYIIDNPTIKFEAVAQMSGFSHPESFYRSFKQQTGLTPNQWLTQYKGSMLTSQSEEQQSFFR